LAIPNPQPGSVIRYAYLWHEEAQLGREEGVKDRPCAVVLAAKKENDETVVIAAPITHTPQPPGSGAIPLPSETQRRLGLDDTPCWIVTREVNRFIWPGPDLRPLRKEDRIDWMYGLLPLGLRKAIQREFRRVLDQRRLKTVNRD